MWFWNSSSSGYMAVLCTVQVDSQLLRVGLCASGIHGLAEVGRVHRRLHQLLAERLGEELAHPGALAHLEARVVILVRILRVVRRERDPIFLLQVTLDHA